MITVTIKQGTLRGIEKKTVFSRIPYYSFLNIPYAKPPIGRLRFQPPEPHVGWSGIYDATKFGNMAFQKKLMSRHKFLGDEDCLYLHVFVPLERLKNKLNKVAVMVFMHGGSFIHGNCDPAKNGPDFLMEKDVILVNVNYRLNIFGFLNLGIPECPGNMGLRDQALAMQWIKDNIKEFGGDPENITALGESAGSASVHYHMISPKGKGLFHKAILQSGNALNQWAFSSAAMEASLRVGKFFGININDRRALLNSLQSIAPQDLFQAASLVSRELIKCNIQNHYPFLPSKETLEDQSLAYLPEVPKVLIQSAITIPVIAGLSEREGMAIFLEPLTRDYVYWNSDNHIIPADVETFDQPRAPIAAEIKKFYFGDRDVSDDTDSEYVDYLTDIYFLSRFYGGFDYIAQSQEPVYIYNFAREGAINYRKTMLSLLVPNITGTTHGDELGYIFMPHDLMNVFIPADGYNEATKKFVHEITSYWTNFAKTGNPNGESTEVIWLNYTPQEPYYLRIGDVIENKKGRLFNNRLIFWERLFSKISNKWYLNKSHL